jgi:hypothetical protein
MRVDPGKASRMQRLHQKRADATDKGAEVRVDDPRGFAGLEKTRTFAAGNHFQPRRHPARVVKEKCPQTPGEHFLNGRVFRFFPHHQLLVLRRPLHRFRSRSVERVASIASGLMQRMVLAGPPPPQAA